MSEGPAPIKTISQRVFFDQTFNKTYMNGNLFQLTLFFATIATLFSMSSCEKESTDETNIQVSGIEFIPNYFEKEGK